MKSLIRACVALSIAFALTISAAPGLSAQAADNCYGLNETDCALANAANGASALQKLSAFTMDYDLTYKRTSAAGATDTSKDTSVTVHGTGPFSVNVAMAAATPEATAAATQAATEMAPGLGMMGHLGAVSIQNTITASVTDAKGTTADTLEFRIVGGMIYFKADKATNGAWKSIALKDLAKRGGNGMGNMGNLYGGQGGASGANIAQMAGVLGALGNLTQTPGVISAKRGTDVTIDNQPIAVFTYTVDLPTLLNSPAMESVVKTLMGRGGDQKMPPAILQAIIKGLAKAFKDTSLSVTRLVGTTDKLPHGLGIDLTAKLDPSAMAPLAGGGTPSASNVGTPFTLDFHFLVKLSGIGTPVTVTAPANSTPADLGPEPTEAATMPAMSATAAPTMAATPAQ